MKKRALRASQGSSTPAPPNGIWMFFEMFVHHPGQQLHHPLVSFRRQVRQLRVWRKQLALTDSEWFGCPHQHLLNRWKAAALRPRPIQSELRIVRQDSSGTIESRCSQKPGCSAHLAAYAGVEHPLRNLQRRRTAHFVPHTPQHQTAAATPSAQRNLLSIPEMPAVVHFSKAGFMGVVYLSCTTLFDRPPRWAIGHPRRKPGRTQNSRGIEKWKIKQRFQLPQPPDDGGYLNSTIAALN